MSITHYEIGRACGILFVVESEIDPASTPAPEHDRWLARVRAIASSVLAAYPSDLYLFGSRARGDFRATSDFDLAVDPRGSLPRHVLAQLRDAFEESTLPIRVDVVDLREASDALRKRFARRESGGTSPRTALDS